MSPEISERYTNRTRVRACGLCWQGEKLLMVNHRMGPTGSLWLPPGGGVEFGEGVTDALQREFQEEAGIRVYASRFQFVCEIIQPPIHALELFFEVEFMEGEVITGQDPEVNAEHQIIREVKYMSLEEILALPYYERHGIFTIGNSVPELQSLTGFYTI